MVEASVVWRRGERSRASSKISDWSAWGFMLVLSAESLRLFGEIGDSVAWVSAEDGWGDVIAT